MRVGFHRYTFPQSDQSAVILDLSTQLGPSGTASGFVKKVSNKKLQGYAIMEKTVRRPKDTKVFFSFILIGLLKIYMPFRIKSY